MLKKIGGLHVATSIPFPIYSLELGRYRLCQSLCPWAGYISGNTGSHILTKSGTAVKHTIGNKTRQDTYLLPLGNEVSVSNVLIKTILIEL